jgi:hypothetical protein
MLFLQLGTLPNKLFLWVCCYKTQLPFYLQKFTLNFSQNYLDLCRFGVQDRQIRGLMKVGKTRWSEHTFIIQYIYLYYCSCCYCIIILHLWRTNYLTAASVYIQSDLTSKFCINVKFVCVNYQTVFHILHNLYIHLWSIYTSNFTCLTIIVHQLLPSNQMLKKIYFTLQKQYFKKVAYFSQSIMTHDFRGLWASGTHRSLLNSGMRDHKLLFCL